MGKPAAQVLLERYWDEVNNEGKLELIRELCANPIVRHDPDGKLTELSHEEQIERVRGGIEVFQIEDGRLAHCWNTPYGQGHWG